MRIPFMKQSALETAKANLPGDYRNYFLEDTNDWMLKAWGEDAFLTYKETPDFELAPLKSGLRPGEIDQKNCEILCQSLPLSPSEAADERLWAGMTNGPFYGYMRERFGYSAKKRPTEKDEKEILSRFFFAGRSRSGIFRNALAKCWWVGTLLRDETAPDPFHRLKTFGNVDFASAVNDIFYNYTFSSNPTVMDGILAAMERCRAAGVNPFSKERPFRYGMQYLNAIGAGVILDVLSSEEICAVILRGVEDHRRAEEDARPTS